MKLHHIILPFVALATAFIIPNERVMSQVALESDHADTFDGEFDIAYEFDLTQQDWKDTFSNVVEASHDAFDNAVHCIKDSFESATGPLQAYEGEHLPSPPPHHEDHPHEDHPPHKGPKGDHPPRKHPYRPHKPQHHPNLTIYEMITKSKYTTKFAMLVNQFDDVVEFLNSTHANITVFVPTDKAFEKIPDHGHMPSREILEKVLAYHIVPSVYPVGRIFMSHTIPTLLNGTYLSHDPSATPQRLAVKFGWTGIFIDGHSRVYVPNILATNGVIHGIDSILIPPPSVAAIVRHSPQAFSTLSLALIQTELHLGTHLGMTLFAPPNFAWAKLGPRINAFLFSEHGTKYLKIILAYHVVGNRTLYSDAYYVSEAEKAETIPKDILHFDLPTLLGNHTLSVDVRRFGRLIRMKINGFSFVIYQDAVAKDGVIQIVDSVLIPPRKPGSTVMYPDELTVESLVERLDPYIADEDAKTHPDFGVVNQEEPMNWDL